ncbi:hypothetical protein [Malaciobacter canalis]|nr:hypothetical protein [Malaciobacter canalis]
MKNKYTTIKIISDDKFFGSKEIQEQMEKLKKLFKENNESN